MHKILKKMSEKFRPKFPATTPGCSMVEIACLDDAFLEDFLTASKPSRRSLQQKEKKRRIRKGEKKKFQKSKSL